jgi:hypothetical protein
LIHVSESFDAIAQRNAIFIAKEHIGIVVVRVVLVRVTEKISETAGYFTPLIGNCRACAIVVSLGSNACFDPPAFPRTEA